MDIRDSVFGRPIGKRIAKTNVGGVYDVGDSAVVKLSHNTEIGEQATELSILQHPNSHGILTAKGVVASVKDGQVTTAILMQRMSHTLSDYLHDQIYRSGWRDDAHFFRAMADLLTGAARMEENGVKHRDHKTTNALVDTKGRVYLCDFGLAVWYQPDEVRSDAFVVTLWYRAPEVCLAGLSTDFTSSKCHNDPFGVRYMYSTDSWSIALMMWEMIFVKPFGSFLDRSIDYGVMPVYEQNMRMLDLIASTVSPSPPKENTDYWHFVDPFGLIRDELKDRWSQTKPKGLLAFAAEHRLQAKLRNPRLVGQIVDMIQYVLGEWDPRRRLSPLKLYNYAHRIFPGNYQIRPYRPMKWVCPWTRTNGGMFRKWVRDHVQAKLIMQMFDLTEQVVERAVTTCRPSARNEPWHDVLVRTVDLALKATWLAQTRKNVFQTLNLLHASMCIVMTCQRRYLSHLQVLRAIHGCQISELVVKSSHAYQVLICELMNGALDTDNVYRAWRQKTQPYPGEVFDGRAAMLQYFGL